MSSLRATLRIARRDARRVRGRSALVVAMIALPVLGVAAVDILARTYELSPDQLASRDIGAADAAFSDTGQATIQQSSGMGFAYEAVRSREPGSSVDLTANLPPGSRFLTDRQRSGPVSVGDRTTTVQLRELAYADPIAAGLYRTAAGRPPATADEVALTTGLADRLGLVLGSELRLADRTAAVRVVGLVEDQNSRTSRTVLVAPGTLPATASDRTEQDRLLVDVPGTLTWADVQAANARGVYVRPRGPVPGQPPEPDVGSGEDGRTLAIAALVVGMALLEVVLLAGPAFAVGAKRSRRQLALLAATGAERRDVRRTVLGSGLVLGAVGGLMGVAGGVALAATGMWLLARADGAVPGPFDLRPLELAAIALVGVGTALLAALLPARAASRQDVVAALTGRRGTVRGSRRTPVIGVLVAIAGAALALYGARERDVLVILAGSALAELGLVATTPALVGLTGRLGPLLPVAPRLALRDAARNRGRTAPVVAAILAAVAGSVAVGTFLASSDAYNKARYEPQALPGTAVLGIYQSSQQAQLPELEAVLKQSLPTREVLRVGSLDHLGMSPAGYVELVAPPAKRCPLTGLAEVSPAQAAAAKGDPRCFGNVTRGGYLPMSMVGDAALLRAVTGAADPELGRVLAAGGVIVPSSSLVDGGQTTAVVHPVDDPDGTRGRPFVLPAAVLPAGAFPVTLYSPAAAERLGMPVTDAGLVAVLDRLPTSREQDTADGALDRLGLETPLYVERGFTGGSRIALLALALGSAVIVLGASGIATGLAAADGRADLATLAAVGATPSARRALAAFQSAVTAVLGTALGVVAGLVPAIGLLRALNSTAGRPEGFVQEFRYPLVIPWESLAITALVVPLLAAAAAAALTRSRLPLVRRLA